jgi:hypothetical protein
MNCSVCGSPVEHDYNFCPHCGAAVEHREDFRQIIDDSFSAVNEIVKKDTLSRIDSLVDQLSGIEEDLNTFLLSKSRDN